MGRPKYRLILGVFVTFIGIVLGILLFFVPYLTPFTKVYICFTFLGIGLYIFLTMSMYTNRYKASTAFARPIMYDGTEINHTSIEENHSIFKLFPNLTHFELKLRIFLCSLFVLGALTSYLIEKSLLFVLIAAFVTFGSVVVILRRWSIKVRWFIDIVYLYIGIGLLISSPAQLYYILFSIQFDIESFVILYVTMFAGITLISFSLRSRKKSKERNETDNRIETISNTYTT